MDGNTYNTSQIEEVIDHEDPQGYVKVQNKKWFKNQRKEMNQSLSQKVTEELVNFKKDKMENPNLKTKPKTQMTPDQRFEEIRDMFYESSLHVGIAPISREHTNRVTQQLIHRGVINPKATPQEKLHITTTSLVKTWTRKHLKLTETEWQDIAIEEIKTTDNSDIIFIKCANQEEAAKLTSRAKFLPQDTGPDTPRIIMHIDSRAKKRHQAILTIAKTIREHSKRSVQTTVRAGRVDFLLRQRPKGSTTPWNQIPPELIRQQLPQIEIGEYRNIFDINEDTIHEDENQMDEIAEIAQNIQTHKRDRSDTIEKPNTQKNSPKNKKTKTKKKTNEEMDTSKYSGSDSDDEPKVMNSTWDPTSRNNQTIGKHSKHSLSDLDMESQNTPQSVLNKHIVQCTPVRSSTSASNQQESLEQNTIPETPAIESMSTQQIEQLRIEQDMLSLTSDWDK